MQDSLHLTLPGVADSASVPVLHDSIVKVTRKKKTVSVPVDSVPKNGTHHVLESNATDVKKNTEVFSAGTEKTKQVNFFGNHELKVAHNGPQPLDRSTPDWVFPLLLLIIVAFAWLRAYYNKYFIQILTAFYNTNLTNQIVRDENILVQRASVLLNIVFNLVAALFLYFVSVHLRWPMAGMGPGLNRYLFFALIVSAAYAMKFLVLKTCGYLFNLDKEMSTYIFNIFLINNVLGILLIPVIAFLAFSAAVSAAWIIKGSLFLVAAAILYRIVRGLYVGITSPVTSFYYLFLYLCTLEIAPLVVLIKILNQT